MAGRRAVRPTSMVLLSTDAVADTTTQRALEATSDAVQRLQSAPRREVVTSDLVIGTNVLRHGLGRAVVGYTLTPTFATIAFGHALNTDNPNPSRELWIDVVGSDQDGARVELW